jgi:zinc transport system substrate-binding protein
MSNHPCRALGYARRRLASTLAAVALAGLLAGCGSSAGSTPGSAGKGGDGGLQVVTSFYPLQFVATRIGGPDATVSSLTRPGAEPHDLELTPRDVAAVQQADLVVYLSGFQPAVDQAVAQHVGGDALDVAPAAHLDLHASGPDDHAEAGDHSDDHSDDHADESTGEGAVDPHFWLDPTRLAQVSAQVADAMAKADPGAAAAFRERATALTGELTALDDAFRTGLAHCASTDLVTSHTAFGYLAQRYGLHQVGITGLSPEAEPDPRSLAAVATFVREHDVSTIYSETLVSPAVARTVARETGATTAVLDPIEGLTDASAGRDYLEVMRSNLAVLQKGQSCS